MASHEASAFILQALHLYNWGAFGGRHTADIDPANTAIIGPTGSGKTTLIDALMTLLCANPKYNLASTGGHESDRDLISYVRGVSGPGAEDSGDHISRSGKTVTAIAARMGDASGQCVLLGGLFWLDGNSFAASDLKRLWFFSEAPEQSMDLWLEEHHERGARGLKNLEKELPGLHIFNSKSAYLAKLRGFFEVGENAFTLLNRAAGLKQLSSIDEIFRELVLDDTSAFDDAARVAEGFDELTAIHAELDLARRQYLSLLPLHEMARRRAHLSQVRDTLGTLKDILPRWFAREADRLWTARANALQEELNTLQLEHNATQEQLEAARADEQTRSEIYLQLGGAGIEDLEKLITEQQRTLSARQSDHDDYLKLLKNLGQTPPQHLTVDSLADQQRHATEQASQIDLQLAQQRAITEEAVAREFEARRNREQYQRDLAESRKRPHSNVPASFQTFRGDLAQHLQRRDDELPFVAELLEVPAEQQSWRGAIERALGSHRLRILVPPAAMRTALDWINQRHNRLHVRLLEAREAARHPRFLDDGYARKLNLKPQPYQSTLMDLLSDLDRHCVDDVQTLQRTAHAMTQKGLMSGKAQFFDKQDQKQLGDDWFTGFDNRDQLARLEARLQTASATWQDSLHAKQTAQQQQDTLSEQSQLWAHLQHISFDDLDTTGAKANLAHSRQRLATLQDPRSDTAQARIALDQARAHTRALADALSILQTRQGALNTQHQQAHREQSLALQRAQPPLDAPQLTLAQAELSSLSSGDCDHITQDERKASQHIQQQFEKQQRTLTELDGDILRQMGKALREDQGALAEVPQDVQDMPRYLERLRVLIEEALPEKQKRFQTYLNDSSEQGVNQLLQSIEAEVVQIEERIEELNQTLTRVDFQPGRYLQLIPQRVVHKSLQNLSTVLNKLRAARLRDDEGESHYQALQEMVALLRDAITNRKTRSAQALLDARYRLQFSVSVRERESNREIERRTGSQGGSGGEKEIIASYVLTASLSYALCPHGRSAPLFGSIVLDEAFSKSSQAVAARIIQALTEFGLHALFVTPNKELRLLRNHTRSAVVVHRRERQATLASMSWQLLDEHAQRRRAMQPSLPPQP